MPTQQPLTTPLSPWNAALPLLLLVVYLGYYFFGWPILTFPDVYWHIAAGDLIRANGIPVQDPWSFTAGETPWHNISWLYDLLLSLAFEYGGEAALTFLLCGLLAGIVAVAYRNALARGVSPETALIIAGIVALALHSSASIRPQIISFLLILLLHHRLHLGWQRPHHLLLLPLLFTLWANLHGGFLAGLMLIFIHFATALWQRQFDMAKCFFWLGLACGISCLLTPLGWQILPAVLSTIHNGWKGYISEWLPTAPFIVLASSVPLMVFILSFNARNRDVPLADKAAAIAFLFMGLDSARNFVMFVLVASPSMAIFIHSFPHKEHAWLKHQAYTPRLILGTASAAFLLAATFTVTMVQNAMPLRKNKAAASSEITAEIVALAERYHGQSLRLYHEYSLGGQLIYRAGNAFRVFADGRAGTAYPDILAQDYHIILTGRAPLEETDSTGHPTGALELLEHYDVQAVLIDKTFPAALRLRLEASPAWHVDYDGARLMLFMRTEEN